jgi:hypothetical protein
LTFGAQHWERLKSVLKEVEGYSGATRDAMLQRLCAEDEALYKDALSLLARESQIGVFERAEMTSVTLGAPVRAVHIASCGCSDRAGWERFI